MIELNMWRKPIRAVSSLVEMATCNGGYQDTPLTTVYNQIKLYKIYNKIHNKFDIIRRSGLPFLGQIAIITTFQQKLKRKLEIEIQYNFCVHHINVLKKMDTFVDEWIIDIKQLTEESKEYADI